VLRLAIGTILALAGAFLVVLIGATVAASSLQLVGAIGLATCLLLAGILIVVDRRKGERRQADRRQAAAQPITVHGPVGSVGQMGGHTSQVNIGHLRRTLTGRDWPSEVAVLTAYAGTAVEVQWNNDPETVAFSKEIRGLLQRSGWREHDLAAFMSPDPPQNIIVRVPEPTLADNPPLAALVASLQRLGVAVSVETGANGTGVVIGSA
jgi:membrane protein implicated in regulation of membrane protease activity